MDGLYDIALQVAVNEMLLDLQEIDALFVLSLCGTGSDTPVSLFLDKLVIEDWHFVDQGIYLLMHTPTQAMMEVIIPYAQIVEIVGFYNDFRHQKTLYYVPQNKRM